MASDWEIYFKKEKKQENMRWKINKKLIREIGEYLG